jgi:signal transduction histidine kinase/FixJ family two-component response regulator
MSTIPPITPGRNLENAPSDEGSSLRILLIEDSADDELLLRRHLQKAGFNAQIHRVETAAGMMAAFENLYDCVLADYNLPQFSAPEALRLLQSTGRDVPFIMMSGAVSEATAVEAMRAGAHDYVSKENLTRLVPAIERELAEASSRRLKRATERALQSSEERFHRLVEAAPLALIIADMEGRITYANSGAWRLMGFRHDDPATGPITLAHILCAGEFGGDPSQPDGAAQIANRLLEKISGPHAETWEITCSHIDGTSIPTLIAAAVLTTEPAPDALQIAIFFVDLRDQKRSEEVLRRTEKLAAAGRLAASIAHEINNPLEAITNCLYLLDQGELPETQRGYLKMAQKELDRVTQITTQTLRFYRQSTRPVLTGIADLLESVLALYEARLRDKAIIVVREFADAPPILALDGEIRQVLTNLIGNAVDAMRGCAQPRTLLLRAHATRGPNDTPAVSILIADRGCGMSSETMTRMFEPFFSTKGITGTGLGLWVSRGIVAKHNGRLQFRSRVGEGTVFRMVLPLESPISNNGHDQGIPTLT